MKEKCSMPTEVYSRVVGYFRPVQSWNEGKKEEFKDRKYYVLSNMDETVVEESKIMENAAV